MSSLDREAAREVLTMDTYHHGPFLNVSGRLLDALEGCVRPTPQQTINRDALRTSLNEWDDYEPGELEDLLDRILALLRPIDGVTLTREEAELAAWALRHVKGWPEVSTPTALDHLARRKALQQRLEAAS